MTPALKPSYNFSRTKSNELTDQDMFYHMCTFLLQNGALQDMGLVVSSALWDLYIRSMATRVSSQCIYRLTSIEIPIATIRRPPDRLILIMGHPLLGKIGAQHYVPVTHFRCICQVTVMVSNEWRHRILRNWIHHFLMDLMPGLNLLQIRFFPNANNHSFIMYYVIRSNFTIHEIKQEMTTIIGYEVFLCNNLRFFTQKCFISDVDYGLRQSVQKEPRLYLWKKNSTRLHGKNKAMFETWRQGK